MTYLSFLLENIEFILNLNLIIPKYNLIINIHKYNVLYYKKLLVTNFYPSRLLSNLMFDFSTLLR